LIEVMIAILLCAITALGMIGLVHAQTRASSFSRRETEAAEIAQDKLEVLRTKAASTASVTTTETGVDSTGLVNNGGPYTRTSVITVTGTQIDIAVTVSWDDGTTTKSVTVRTFRAGT
jgi:Tfp pilus assembly protein PilV